MNKKKDIGVPPPFGSREHSIEHYRSALKAAQDALQESEKRFETLLGLSTNWYWEQDENLRFTRISEKVTDTEGVHPAFHMGKTRWELASPEEGITDWEQHKAVLARREPFSNLEHKKHDEKGELIWVSTSGVPIFDSENNFKGYQGTSTVITEQKNLEIALKESEEHLRLALDVAQIGIWEWDLNSDQVVWDKRQFQLFGQPEIGSAIPMSSINDMMHPDDIEQLRETTRKIVENRTSETQEFRVIHPDGSIHWLLVNSGFVESKSIESAGKIVGVNMDITAHKEIEFKLKKSEERLQMAFDVAKIGVFELDSYTDQLTLENREFKLLDLPAAATTISWTSYKKNIHPEDLESVIETERYVIENRAPTSVEYRVINPDGSISWIQASCGLLRSDIGSSKEKIIGINVEITERKETEIALDRSRQELADLAQTLEDRVAKRTAELKLEADQHAKTQIRLAASQRLDSIGQLAGGIAHDSNNLLSIILGNLELAAFKVTDPDALEMIEDAQAAAKMGVDLNRSLLGFARKKNLTPVRLAIGLRVLETVRLLERTIRENVRIVTRIERNIWDVMADPSEVTNALVNLAVNARDAMGQGGYLSIEARNAAFNGSGSDDSSDERLGDYVEISVTDSGTGMSADVLKQALDPFFTTKELGKGTGLGLSSVHGFAEQSGGFITIESEVGEGTTVQLFLPRAVEHKLPMAKSADKVRLPASFGEVILVVEDDPKVRKTTMKRLEHIGYEVLEASTGLDAIEVLKGGSPIELVFSDIMMPGGMTGYHLAQWLTKHRPDVKVLLTSGYDDPDQGGREHADIDDIVVLRKPHSLEDLTRGIRDALKR